MRSLHLFLLVGIAIVVRKCSARRLIQTVIASDPGSNKKGYDSTPDAGRGGGRRYGDGRSGNDNVRHDRDNYYRESYHSNNDDNGTNGGGRPYDDDDRSSGRSGARGKGRQDNRDDNIGDSRAYKDSRQQQSILVESYMRSLPSRMLVALSAAASGAISSIFISKMIVSKAPLAVPMLSSFIFFIFCFFPGNVGDLSRSLGVFSIIILRHTTFIHFLLRLLSYLKSVLKIAPRNVFPPGADNPWTYSPTSNRDPDFKMMNALLAVIVLGGFCGLTISKRIPFFPGWIGSIGGALACGYFSTGKDSSGDFLRYIGYGCTTALAEMMATSDDVKLQDKLGSVLSSTLAFGMKIDSEYHFMKTFKFMIAKLVGFISMFARNIQRDMQSGRQTRPSENSTSFQDSSYDFDGRNDYDDGRTPYR